MRQAVRIFAIYILMCRILRTKYIYANRNLLKIYERAFKHHLRQNVNFKNSNNFETVKKDYCFKTKTILIVIFSLFK